jgi:hypothetical protein
LFFDKVGFPEIAQKTSLTEINFALTNMGKGLTKILTCLNTVSSVKKWILKSIILIIVEAIQFCRKKQNELFRKNIGKRSR